MSKDQGFLLDGDVEDTKKFVDLPYENQFKYISKCIDKGSVSQKLDLAKIMIGDIKSPTQNDPQITRVLNSLEESLIKENDKKNLDAIIWLANIRASDYYLYANYRDPIKAVCLYSMAMALSDSKGINYLNDKRPITTMDRIGDYYIKLTDRDTLSALSGEKILTIISQFPKENSRISNNSSSLIGKMVKASKEELNLGDLSQIYFKLSSAVENHKKSNSCEIIKDVMLSKLFSEVSSAKIDINPDHDSRTLTITSKKVFGVIESQKGVVVTKGNAITVNIAEIEKLSVTRQDSEAASRASASSSSAPETAIVPTIANIVSSNVRGGGRGDSEC